MVFQDLFSTDKERMEWVIRGNTLEQNHFKRCMFLSDTIEWESGHAGIEFRAMLGMKGILILDKTIKRINALLSEKTAPELRNQREFLRNLMFVHDLGKYNKKTLGFDGANHGERSADLAAEKKRALLQGLHWREESVYLFINLVRYHGSFGIIRLGEASIVFLSPLLIFLSSLSPERRRLFLDLLILVTCCDAGASGNFAANRFYLDYSRIKFYSHLSEELLALAARVEMFPHADARLALIQQASGFIPTADRIRSIVTSGNRLTVSQGILDAVLKKACSKGEFNPKRFALTRFDHGAYVFEPLLAKLQQGRRAVSMHSLYKILFFLGLLCKDRESPSIIRFRDSFSVKPGLKETNEANFSELFDAVQGGDRRRMKEVLAKHLLRFYPENAGCRDVTS
jgi:hypothetical protein